jgi:hypothetical protein
MAGAAAEQQLSRARAGAGKSSSRGQQQRVPPWHVQFLAAVGAPAWRADWRKQVMGIDQLITMQLHSLCGVSQAMQMQDEALGLHAAGSRGGSSSCSSSTGGVGASHITLPTTAKEHQKLGQESAPVSQQRSLEELLPARETLLLLLEVILLWPEVATMRHCCLRFQHIWSRKQPTPAHAVAVATACVPDTQQMADTMLQPVLRLLGPAALQKFEAASSSGAGSSSSSSDAGILGDRDVAGYFSGLVKLIAAAGAVFCG